MEFQAGVEVCAMGDTDVFAAPDSYDVIRTLEVTELVSAAGGVVLVGATRMLPILPCGAVRADCVDILEPASSRQTVDTHAPCVSGVVAEPAPAQVGLDFFSYHVVRVAFFTGCLAWPWPSQCIGACDFRLGCGACWLEIGCSISGH